MSDIAIRVENLGKKFEIGHQVQGDLRSSMMSKLQRLIGNSGNTKEEFWALKDISFEIKKGEAVGIIGRNGAGKSTLLKILSRITDPTTGRFEINGRVSSLLEVGTGFHPELSGRENIYLNGTILGMKRKEIKAKFDEIVSFSGVEKFIDTPVKHYSSGMKVRLAFSVAAHLEPEILIVDEVLAVGDAEFQKKCLGKMDEVSKNEGRTVLFVSHNMSAVRHLCKKGILLSGGKIISLSTIEMVLNDYLLMAVDGLNESAFSNSQYIHSFTLANKTRSLVDKFLMGDLFEFQVKTKRNSDSDRIHLGFFIKDSSGKKICSLSTAMKGLFLEVNQAQRDVIFTPMSLPLVEGKYFLDVSITSVEKMNRLEFWENIVSFNVEQYDVYQTGAKVNSHLGNFYIDYNVTIK